MRKIRNTMRHATPSRPQLPSRPSSVKSIARIEGLLGRFLAFALLFGLGTSLACAQGPLPSWKDTASKKAIVAFVEDVTKESSPDFVPVAERIAVFDNDGTLWAEQPM